MDSVSQADQAKHEYKLRGERVKSAMKRSSISPTRAKSLLGLSRTTIYNMRNGFPSTHYHQLALLTGTRLGWLENGIGQMIDDTSSYQELMALSPVASARVALGRLYTESCTSGSGIPVQQAHMLMLFFERVTSGTLDERRTAQVIELIR